MSVVEELVGQTDQIKITIDESLAVTRAVVEQIGESIEQLQGARAQVESATTGTNGVLENITEAKQTTAGILGEGSVGGFVLAEQSAARLHQQLDGIRQALEDLEVQFSAVKDETDIVSDQDTGALATAADVITHLTAQANQQ